MLTSHNNKIHYRHSLCQQCGACVAVCPRQAVTAELRTDGTHDIAIDSSKCVLCGRCVSCCPAGKAEDYEGYFDRLREKKYFLGHNADSHVRRESSSGGVCKTIITESLRQGLADGVYSLARTGRYPFAEGRFYTQDNIPEYDDMPNSVYHSVMACSNISQIKRCRRLILVGTSCQLRAMNAALRGKADETIRVCIFCKQQKTLDSTRFLAKIMGTSIPGDLNFSVRYRGQGWPGIVTIREAELPYSRAAQLPFGHRLWTVPGCDICGDAFGTNAGADITLMDPWCIRKPDAMGETLVIAQSKAGVSLLDGIKNLCLEQTEYDDVEPALSLKDVWRKQQLRPFFLGEECSPAARKAGQAELRQRRRLTAIVETLPRMPVICYRLLSKLPDLRNKILK